MSSYWSTSQSIERGVLKLVILSNLRSRLRGLAKPESETSELEDNLIGRGG